jgi:hypothetical protein
MYSRQTLQIGILAAATLLFESTLTRLLAISQYYHFAFLVVSLALLGYGASGSILSFIGGIHRLRNLTIDQIILYAGVGFSISVGIAYLIVNFLPFDSYSIAWDPLQILYFGLYYLSLTIPFIISGIAVGAAINAGESRNHIVYAANLFGSGLGALAAPLALRLAGVPGAVLLSCLLGLVICLPPFVPNKFKDISPMQRVTALVLISGLIAFSVLSKMNIEGRSPLGMVLSPYKGLRNALRYPKAEKLYGRWNAISRIDVIQNAGIHRLPGLSYIYTGEIPPQLGFSTDGQTPQPVTLIIPKDFSAADYLPESIVFKLLDNPKTLVLEPGGGLGVLQALTGGSTQVSAVMGNPLETLAIQNSSSSFNVFHNPSVEVIIETGRIFLDQTDDLFDIVFIPLNDPYQPVASGAYSLSEEYLHTVEAYAAALAGLSPDGIFVVTRWLQVPPSEGIRTFATFIGAMEMFGVRDPDQSIVAFRGIQTMTIIGKPSGWNEVDLRKIQQFVTDLKYDFVWMPDVKPEMVNQNNILPEPLYFQAVEKIFSDSNRSEFYRSHQFNIIPQTDDHPFFNHYFKWAQTQEVIATLGHTWQPFGGSGFLILFALLGLVCILSLVLIVLPLVFIQTRGLPEVEIKVSFQQYWGILAYFSFLGLAFLFVEIPLIQKTILLIGHPIYAFTLVVFVILFFSGFGSAVARRQYFHSKKWIILTAGFALVTPFFYDRLISLSLGWSLIARIGVVFFSLAPMAFFMGIPFPFGLICLEKRVQGLFPWIWAVNGSMSVLSSVLAAILALSQGFNLVMFLGGLLYSGAVLIFLFSLQHLES